MKINALNIVLAGSLAVLAGCVNPDGSTDHTGGGALAGGALGAASGALIGSTRGNAGEGALIGAAIGTITGGLIGHSMDQDESARLQAQAPQTYTRVEQGQPLSVADVKALAQAKISDDLIISQIRTSHTVFRLSSADIIDLHNSGVSDTVVDFMINTPNTAGADAASAPATAQATTVYVAQQPPPVPVEPVIVAPGPGYVWVGGEWVWNGRWVWRTGYWSYPPRPHTIWISGSWGHGPHGWHHYPGHWR